MGSVAGFALAPVGASLASQLPQTTPKPTPGAEPATAPLFEISLAEWSLHRTLRKGALDPRDFASTARKLFGITAVEHVNQFFKDKARDAQYLADMMRRATDSGVRNLLIMIDDEGDLGAPDSDARTRAIENHRPWLAAAKTLGCHSIRVNAESSGTPDEQRKLAADGLSRLAEHAAQLELYVLVENHGGLSSNGAWLASVMQTARHPRLGTLPDFGNFEIKKGEWYDRYQGVRELMPFARAVSAKSHDFDPATGEETATDYKKMLRIVLAAGYHGYVGIEYEGDKLSEEAGIRATLRLLETVREALKK